jgi:hypothetical protein
MNKFMRMFAAIAVILAVSGCDERMPDVRVGATAIPPGVHMDIMPYRPPVRVVAPSDVRPE